MRTAAAAGSAAAAMRVTFYFRSIFRSSSGVVVGAMPKCSTRYFSTFGERNAVSVGPRRSRRSARAPRARSSCRIFPPRRSGFEFDIPFSLQQLADYLAVERSGLSLELGKLKKEGLLDFHKNHFILKV